MSVMLMTYILSVCNTFQFGFWMLVDCARHKYGEAALDWILFEFNLYVWKLFREYFK